MSWILFEVHGHYVRSLECSSVHKSWDLDGSVKSSTWRHISGSYPAQIFSPSYCTCHVSQMRIELVPFFFLFSDLRLKETYFPFHLYTFTHVYLFSRPYYMKQRTNDKAFNILPMSWDTQHAISLYTQAGKNDKETDLCRHTRTHVSWYAICLWHALDKSVGHVNWKMLTRETKRCVTGIFHLSQFLEASIKKNKSQRVVTWGNTVAILILSVAQLSTLCISKLELCDI